MIFTNAKLQIDSGDPWLCLMVEDQKAVMRFLDDFKSDKKYTAELKLYHEKRSLEANAYCWILCDKIAKVIKSTKEDVYRHAVRSVGVFTPIPVRDDALQAFIKKWAAGGIGWFAEESYKSKLDGYTTVHAYFGSSSYDVHEMFLLVEFIIDEAKELGIETATPEQIENMKSLWKEKE